LYDDLATERGGKGGHLLQFILGLVGLFYSCSHCKQSNVGINNLITFIVFIREKPRDIEWNELNAKKIPLLLNYAQCKLLLQDYYAVIEHCTTVLEFDPGELNQFDLSPNLTINVV
jgi:hypothetical protein